MDMNINMALGMVVAGAKSVEQENLQLLWMHQYGFRYGSGRSQVSRTGKSTTIIMIQHPSDSAILVRFMMS